jgi:hypothetical protein
VKSVIIRFFAFFGAFGLLAFETEAQVPPYADEHLEAFVDLNNTFARAEPIAEPVMAEPAMPFGWKTVSNFEFGKNRGQLTMVADLSALHPYFRDRIILLLHNCRKKGINLAIVETYRSPSKQNEYKTMGKKYTRSRAGRSKHQYGLAIDVVPVIDSVAQWDNRALWRKVGAEGEKLGLRWGGRWRHLYDPGHFEWTGGLGSSHLAMGLMPRVPNSKLYPCLDADLVELRKWWQQWDEHQLRELMEENTAVAGSMP